MRFNHYIFVLFSILGLGVNAQSNCSGFSTYFGGSQFDELKGVCTDADKNSYVIGNTYSINLPVTNGLINDTHSGDYDIFLTKFDSCGGLLWCTYFGTPGFESGEKIKLTHDGNIVFCGYTSGVNLPVSSGCFQASNNGGYDCFVAKLTPNGTIIWSTYFGKTNGDFAYDVTIDPFDNIIIGGTTTSTNLYTTISSFQPNHKGNTDAFIARFSKEGAFKWCTYYGGSGNEDIHALTTDNQFNIIGIGGTFSPNLNTSPGAYQAVNEGNPDAYILKLDSNCARVFSTYLGGSGLEDAWGVATDAAGQIYMAGHTTSTDFDTTALAYQTVKQGTLSDWYLTKWSASGSLLTSTLFGGSDNDLMARMAFITPNKLMLVGKTESTDMPVIGINNQPSLAGAYDSFLALFDTGTMLPVWSGYHGGAQDEDPLDICAVSSGIIFAGSTNSLNYPLSASPYQSSLNMSNDGMITRLNLQPMIPTHLTQNLKTNVSISPNPFNNRLHITHPFPFTIEIKTPLGETILLEKNETLIYTENLSPGMYFMTVSGSGYSHTAKMIKE
ncbi:MAG: SBBP repeat-containing protein [Bacteroidota bacterium]